jgi:hypothetical protein
MDGLARRFRVTFENEVVMAAYLLLLVAVLSRVVPHAGWWNFTAVTGGLIYFGARRSWREMLAPLAALAATDAFLTVIVYHFSFHWQDYAFTWGWSVLAMLLGRLLLSKRTTFVRGASASLLGPTSFFVVSNFGVWLFGMNMYPHTPAGLATCYWAAVPFYRNDLLATSLVLGVALGLPALLRRTSANRAQTALAAK